MTKPEERLVRTSVQLEVLRVFCRYPPGTELYYWQVRALTGKKRVDGTLLALLHKGLLSRRKRRPRRYVWRLGPLADVLKEQGVLK